MHGSWEKGKINKHYCNMTSSFVSLPPLCRSQMEIQVETAGSSPQVCKSVLKMFQKQKHGDSQHHLEKRDSSTYLVFQSEKLPLVPLRRSRLSLFLRDVRLGEFLHVQLLHQLVHTGLKQRLGLLTDNNKTESQPTGQISNLVTCNRGALALPLCLQQL